MTRIKKHDQIDKNTEHNVEVIILDILLSQFCQFHIVFLVVISCPYIRVRQFGVYLLIGSHKYGYAKLLE